ncbi:MAG: 2Fe-2S iron-sulfur cluster-binding protein, partial [Anaerolineales bacterium]|nr:2Fe-2S iron-sulfur cluster-binding protein [Anaerolineales bacterium]
MEHTVTFQIAETGASATAKVPTGSLLVEALQKASVDISQPCGGQGRCGRCIVQVTEGNIRRRSALRLSAEDIAEGYALACQSVVEGDLQVFVPPQEKIARRMTSDRTAAEVRVPENYDFRWSQTIRRIPLRLNPPSMDDQTDDWGRLQTALRTQASISPLDCSVSLLRRIGGLLREAEWEVTAIVDLETGEAGAEGQAGRLIDVRPGLGSDDDPLYAAAIDIGTTTVTFWLVDLVTG